MGEVHDLCPKVLRDLRVWFQHALEVNSPAFQSACVLFASEDLRSTEANRGLILIFFMENGGKFHGSQDQLGESVRLWTVKRWTELVAKTISATVAADLNGIADGYRKYNAGKKT